MGIGCCAGASKPYLQKDMLSNRSVEHENQTPVYHHGIGSTACGYGFNISVDIPADCHPQLKLKQQNSDLYQQLQQLYIQLKHLYKEHDIDSCMPLIQQLKEINNQLDYKYLDVSVEQQQTVKEFIADIEERYREMIKFTKYMDPEGWTNEGQKKGIQMYSRREDETVGMLMEKEVDISVQIFLTVLAEMEFYDQLIHTITQSRQDRYIDRNHKIGYCLFDLPVLSVREAVFEGVGYNRLKINNSIFMYSQSIHNRPDICKKLNFTPTLNPKYVQIDYKYLVIQYVPTGVNKGKASVAINIDMKLTMVPMFLMELVSKTFCNDFLTIVMEVSKKYPGSKWQKKVKRHPQTFEFFRSIIQKYYKQQNFSQIQPQT